MPATIRSCLRSAFCQEYATELEKWGACLAEESGPIIAISRKAPRLIELASREGLIAKSVLQRVTTERGLATAGALAVGENAILCDDTIIVGSTFRRFEKLAQEIFGVENVRGIPFAVGANAIRDNFESVSPYQPYMRLTADRCTSFVNAEIAAFAALGKPYDTEHPIISLDLQPEARTTEVTDALREASARAGCSVYPTVRRLATTNGVSELERAWTLLACPGRATPETFGLRKVRSYFDHGRNRLLLVPINPQSGTLADLDLQASALPVSLRRCWEAFRRNVPDDAGSSLELRATREYSLVAWANYLLELADLATLIAFIREALAANNLIDHEARVTTSLFDLQLLVGTELADDIRGELDLFLGSAPNETVTQTVDELKQFIQPKLPPAYQESYDLGLRSLLEGSDSVSEVLEAIFKAQHIGIEIESRATNARDPARLDFGVSLGYLQREVESKIGAISAIEFHQAFDSLIDAGVIVPRYLRCDEPESDYWFRSFRVGEGQANIREHLTRECFEILALVMESANLPEVLTEKFFVLASDLTKVLDNADARNGPQIGRGFHLYGARPQVIVDGKQTWLVDWSVRKRILRRIPTGDSSAYALDERAERYYPKGEPALSPFARNQIAALARWTREATTSKQLGLDFLIAITTVESNRAFQQAIAAELRGWAFHEHWGLTAALNALEDLAANQTHATRHRAGDCLASLANWHAQSREKYRLRDRFAELMRVADSLWADKVQDTSGTWRNIVRPKLDERANDIVRPPGIIEKELFPTLAVVGRLTSLLRNIASEFGGLRDLRARGISESADEVIAAIQALPMSIRELFDVDVARLSALSTTGDLVSALVAVRQATNAIAEGVEHVLTLDSDFSAEPLDPIGGGVFIVLWDVRDSTHQDTREPLSRRIMEVNQRVSRSLRPRLLHFDEKSTDDGNAAVCDRFDAAIEVAETVARGFAPEFAVKIGCETNVEGTLTKSRASGRLGGRAYELAARMQAFFSEIAKFPDRWVGDSPFMDASPIEPSTRSSYLVVSEQAYRLAAESQSAAEMSMLEVLPGMYKPRVKNAYRRRVYIHTYEA
jgi:hypothetical protein